MAEGAKELERRDAKRLKPMLTIEGQITHLKTKGITFELCDEKDAADYLEHGNNYLRATSYRKLYPVHLEGPQKGKYIGLDFAALIALSSADRILRSALREICIDVEHFARLGLLNRCAAHGEDGYAVVADFLEHQKAHGNTRTESGLKARSSSGKHPDTYSGELIAHYLDDLGGFSIWAFLEVTDFGQFADLWLFCSHRWDDTSMREMHYILKSVKALRNACSHNSCIINGFTTSAAKSGYETPDSIIASLNEHGIKNSKGRRAKLANLRIAQVAATLFSSCTFCTRPSTRERHATVMAQARKTIELTSELRPADGSLTAYFDFLFKMIDIWTPRWA